MALRLIEKDEQYYFNYCAKLLARGPASAGDQPNLTTIAEAWRFPIIDTGPAPDTNAVSFLYDTERAPVKGGDIRVVGTFGNLYEPLAMRRLRFLGEDSAYLALTAEVPKRELHRYCFIVDGKIALDPINPQRVVLDDGQQWSQFFTQELLRPVTFERWQLRLMQRMTDQLMPFRTRAAQNFIERHLQGGGATGDRHLYRLDDSVGELNYIDKLLAREERHHLVDYQICLREIDRLLRQRNPYMDPEDMPAEMFTTLYEQMAQGEVPGWNYSAYSNPRYFLTMLRRHVATGAFCHPKHGGNIGAAGWAYLAETYRNQAGENVFAWERAMEPPLGENEQYRG